MPTYDEISDFARINSEYIASFNKSKKLYSSLKTVFRDKKKGDLKQKFEQIEKVLEGIEADFKRLAAKAGSTPSAETSKALKACVEGYQAMLESYGDVDPEKRERNKPIRELNSALEQEIQASEAQLKQLLDAKKGHEGGLLTKLDRNLESLIKLKESVDVLLTESTLNPQMHDLPTRLETIRAQLEVVRVFRANVEVRKFEHDESEDQEITDIKRELEAYRLALAKLKKTEFIAGVIDSVEGLTQHLALPPENEKFPTSSLRKAQFSSIQASIGKLKETLKEDCLKMGIRADELRPHDEGVEGYHELKKSCDDLDNMIMERENTSLSELIDLYQAGKQKLREIEAGFQKYFDQKHDALLETEFFTAGAKSLEEIKKEFKRIWLDSAPQANQTPQIEGWLPLPSARRSDVTTEDDSDYLLIDESEDDLDLKMQDLIFTLIKDEAKLTVAEQKVRDSVQEMDMRLPILAKVYGYFFKALSETQLTVKNRQKAPEHINSESLDKRCQLIEKKFQGDVISAMKETLALLQSHKNKLGDFENKLSGLMGWIRKLFEKICYFFKPKHKQRHEFFGKTTYDKLKSMLEPYLPSTESTPKEEEHPLLDKKISHRRQ